MRILIGNSMTGLGHTYLKMGNYDFSKLNYYAAIQHLKASNNDEVLCEAYLGLANLYKRTSGNHLTLLSIMQSSRWTWPKKTGS